MSGRALVEPLAPARQGSPVAPRVSGAGDARGPRVGGSAPIYHDLLRARNGGGLLAHLIRGWDVFDDWSWRHGLMVPAICVALLIPPTVFVATNATHPGALYEAEVRATAARVPPSPTPTPAPAPTPTPPKKKPKP